MRRIFDFECPDCGNTFEELIDDKIRKIPCTEAGCSGKAVRQLSAPRIDWKRMGLDPGFPSASDRWAKAARKHHATDQGSMRQGKRPNLSMY